MSEKKTTGKMVCKHGCGAEFDYTPTGQAALMRHYKFDCPNKPVTQKQEPKDESETLEEPIKETRQPEYISSESIPSMTETLERIIREVSQSKKIPGVLRHVKNYLDKPLRSFEELENIMTMADFAPMDRKVILKNWATYLKLGDVDKLIESAGKDEAQKKDEKDKKKDEEIETGDAIDKELERSTKAVMRDLQLLRLRKERKMLEQELQEPKPEAKKEEEEKQTLVVDGVPLKVTVNEMLAWKKYLSEEKEREDERQRRREEQKIKDEERLKRRDDDAVEWPIGDKVIKVKPETIPMLVMQQTQKKEENPELKLLLEETKLTREEFHKFQLDTLKKEIDEMKAYAQQDPLDRLYASKEKLEKLGIVRSDKMSAQEQLYQMDHKKLDALLSIALDKSKSTENKVNTLLTTIGPAAQEYIREMVLQLKQSRGASATEVPRTEQQASEALAKLEEIDKAMESANKTPRVISVGKTEPKPEPPKEGS